MIITIHSYSHWDFRESFYSIFYNQWLHWPTSLLSNSNQTRFYLLVHLILNSDQYIFSDQSLCILFPWQRPPCRHDLSTMFQSSMWFQCHQPIHAQFLPHEVSVDFIHHQIELNIVVLGKHGTVYQWKELSNQFQLVSIQDRPFLVATAICQLFHVDLFSYFNLQTSSWSSKDLNSKSLHSSFRP